MVALLYASGLNIISIRARHCYFLLQATSTRHDVKTWWHLPSVTAVHREKLRRTLSSPIVAPTRSIKITCFINYNRILHKTTNPYLPVIYSVLLSPHQDPIGKNQNAISRYSLTVLANSNRALYKSMLVLHSVRCIHRWYRSLRRVYWFAPTWFYALVSTSAGP